MQMRMLVLAQIPTNDKTTEAVRAGVMEKVIGNFIKTHNPEVAYFAPIDGKRTGVFIVDVKDPSDMPSITEPFFQLLGATVTFVPAMSLQEMGAGVHRATEAVKAAAQ